MPLFEYECCDCGRAFEAFVTADRAPGCPGCGSARLTKLISPPGMVGSAQPGLRADRDVPRGGCGAGGNACACRARLD
jgi:putative FmdB family regulatory protein